MANGYPPTIDEWDDFDADRVQVHSWRRPGGKGAEPGCGSDRLQVPAAHELNKIWVCDDVPGKIWHLDLLSFQEEDSVLADAWRVAQAAEAGEVAIAMSPSGGDCIGMIVEKESVIANCPLRELLEEQLMNKDEMESAHGGPLRRSTGASTG